MVVYRNCCVLSSGWLIRLLPDSVINDIHIWIDPGLQMFCSLAYELFGTIEEELYIDNSQLVVCELDIMWNNSTFSKQVYNITHFPTVSSCFMHVLFMI